MYHNFFIHSSIDGHLGCFYVLAIKNNAAMNIGVHVSFSIMVSLGFMPSSGIVRSYGGFERLNWTVMNSILKSEVLYIMKSFLTLRQICHNLSLSVTDAAVFLDLRNGL